jgi:ethanolamine-phosphate cytidylyltransferase
MTQHETMEEKQQVD